MLYILFILLCTNIATAAPHYYCTPSDAHHYPLLKNLIGSLHHIEFDSIGEIAVFDLGLNPDQRHELTTMQKVCVYDVEMTHPQLLTYFQTSPYGRCVRGFYAWKPVMIKQALEKFPYVLYIDAGATILQPLDDLFTYIQETGYFLMSNEVLPPAQNKVVDRVTKKVIDEVIRTFPEDIQYKLLDENTIDISAGLQGVSREMYDCYIKPMYEHTKNLHLFADDGTARMGYGEGRHDQTLFSIYAHKLGLKITPMGWAVLPLKKGPRVIHIYWNPKHINKYTIIYQSRWDMHFQGGHTQYIKYKGSACSD